MRVRFLKDWQSENSASFKKDDITVIEDLDLAWNLAVDGIVRFKKDIDPELEVEKKRIKESRKRGEH